MPTLLRLSLILCLLAVQFIPTPAQADSQTPANIKYYWTPLPTSGAPDARKFFGYAWAEELGDLFIWGGYYNDQPATGYRYHPETDVWELLPPSPVPLGTGYPSVVWAGAGGTGDLIVWGGFNNKNGARYNPATGTWKVMSSLHAPTLYIGQSTVWTGTEMIVWGQASAYASGTLGARYNPAADTWTPVSTVNAPGPWIVRSVVWTGEEMIIWGGTNDYSSSNSGARYNPRTDTWTPVSTLSAPTARNGHSAVWTGDRMLVWGGQSNFFTSLADGAAYDPVTDTWEAIPAAPIGGRNSHAAIWAGSPFNEMVVWGGENTDQSGSVAFFNDGARYNPATRTWTVLPGAIGFEGRSEPAAVWTGPETGELLIWGGLQSDGYFNDGARYNLAQNAWSISPSKSVPTGRTSHTAIWTGKPDDLNGAMIVWGGRDAGHHILNTGESYNLLRNTWSPISDVGAPSARSQHTAVWTGGLADGSLPGEMIIWGGISESGEFLNTGGRYDPVTDTWQPVSTVNAPSPRWLHTAVWTGAEMIIWGGGDGDFFSSDTTHQFNTGARYNPSTDTWTPMSTINAPDPRNNHIALWTGTEMVVWGGRVSGIGSVNTGARYDPAADTWTPIPVPILLEPREDHVAAWAPVPSPAGSVIIWGGCNLGPNGGGRCFNSGARFDLAEGTWQPISTSNGPGGSMKSSVWTGSKMVVWGGSSGDFGGAYDPAADSWERFPIIGQPAPRMYTTLVWAGPPTTGKLIAWGGHVSIPLNTGGVLHSFEVHSTIYLPVMIQE